jgi:hypothetical protein
MNNLESSNVDINGLRNLYKSNPVARILLESFAARQNNCSMTTVGSLHSILRLAAYDISRQDIIKIFKELQKLNCGEFELGNIKGDRKHQSRFIWKVSLVSVGKAATDKKLRN